MRMHCSNGSRSTTNQYREYLAWLHRSTRMRVRPLLSNIHIDEGDNGDEDCYDKITRLERALLKTTWYAFEVTFSSPLVTFSRSYQ